MKRTSTLLVLFLLFTILAASACDALTRVTRVETNDEKKQAEQKDHDSESRIVAETLTSFLATPGLPDDCRIDQMAKLVSQNANSEFSSERFDYSYGRLRSLRFPAFEATISLDKQVVVSFFAEGAAPPGYLERRQPGFDPASESLPSTRNRTMLSKAEADAVARRFVAFQVGEKVLGLSNADIKTAEFTAPRGYFVLGGELSPDLHQVTYGTLTFSVEVNATTGKVFAFRRRGNLLSTKPDISAREARSIAEAFLSAEDVNGEVLAISFSEVFLRSGELTPTCAVRTRSKIAGIFTSISTLYLDPHTKRIIPNPLLNDDPATRPLYEEELERISEVEKRMTSE